MGLTLQQIELVSAKEIYRRLQESKEELGRPTLQILTGVEFYPGMNRTQFTIHMNGLDHEVIIQVIDPR